MEVSGPTVVTRPTSPSPLRTVMSRSMPSLLPASMVTVQEKPWAAPMAMTSRALDAVLPGARRLEHLVELARAGCGCWSSLPSFAFSAAFSRSSAAMRSVPFAGVAYGAYGVADRVDRGRHAVLDRAEDRCGGLPGAVDR